MGLEKDPALITLWDRLLMSMSWINAATCWSGGWRRAAYVWRA